MPAVDVPVPDSSSTMLAAGSSSGEGVAGVVREGSHETTAVLSNSVQEDKDGRVDDPGDRNLYGGNRWPRQETLALLKIRSQMDAAFRDSSLKAPLWEDVSRKLGELGYYRSAKKCKEKFENVYKYHRRTKEGRSGKQEGKTYRFFDELEAFDHQNNHPSVPPKSQVLLWPNNHHHPNNPTVVSHVITSVVPLSSTPNMMATTNGSPNGSHISPPPINSLPPQVTKPVNLSPQNLNGFKPSLATSNLFSSSTSSTASDEEFQVQQRSKKKRKWKYFFRRLTKEVLEKQEKLQEKFLEAIVKCEHERTVREEAWRMQEMARLDKEHQILAQERSSAAAKDVAVIEFLQKVSGQQNVTNNIQAIEVNRTIPSRPQPLMPPPPPAPVAVITTSFEVPRLDNGDNSIIPPGSTRWPRVEVEALINLRTCLDVRYQEAGPKGSLWEEISAGMKRLGYNRSAKRCKEKWENINKYFKKVKESSKTRPEDSKTCPYFNQLESCWLWEKPLPQAIQPLIKVHPDQPAVEAIQRENGDKNEEDEDGESTEEEDHHLDHSNDDDQDEQMGIVTNYKESSMEMVES
ncbi:trihelix transcription factor GT-2-like [Prunus yedoensis var. nudiflora]|uniref:Trihelix transcription factor GT-2-like n=1 Tax=Prunus yedoensis var. nudiflora TaxID=2094558 RepID=A0A314YNX5_PRUYE|nr:trihelix transcription factor GT-2-like [Prunus yedoensis var. nudiflora]